MHVISNVKSVVLPGFSNFAGAKFVVFELTSSKLSARLGPFRRFGLGTILSFKVEPYLLFSRLFRDVHFKSITPRVLSNFQLSLGYHLRI